MKLININNNWDFAKLPDSNISSPECSDTGFIPVSVPHTWYTDEDQYRGLTVYKKCISVESDWKKVYVEFCGADQTCKVYVNHVLAGEHKGAYSTFRVEVPETALQSGELELEVYLDNTPNEKISPTFGDFTVFGGMYRDVNLMVVGENHFDYMYYGTDGIIIRSELIEQEGVLRIEPHVVTEAADAIVKYVVVDEAGNVVAESQSASNESVEIRVAAPAIWNGRKNAHLYTVKASLIVNGQVADQTEKTTGFRTFEMNADTGFFLNGVHTKINGVSKHQDTAEKFSAISQEDIDRDFEMIDEVGANAVRLSHYQHVQNTYDLCDREGYIVWAEIPMLKMTQDEDLLSNAREQLKELVLQNIHHPSIICWGIQNEIGMFRDADYMHKECENLRDIAKKIDSTRLVTCANLFNVKAESKLNAITDMVGYNLYFGWYYGEMKDYSNYLDNLHKVNPEMPFGISEYGVDNSPFLHSDEPKVKDYSEEYSSLYHQTVYPIFKSKDYMWGSFIWNMFDFSSSRRDEGGVKYINQKGIVTFDRKIKKDAFYYYKAQWSNELFVHICSKRYAKRTADQIEIKVFTNVDEVKLVSNQLTMTQKNDGNGTVIFENVPLTDGNNEFTVVATLADGTEMKDQAVFEKVETAEESYVLKNSGAGSAVKNWFLDDDTLIKEGYYSVEDATYDIVECSETMEVLKEFVPDLAKELSGDTRIPLGFPLLRVISYNKEVAEKVDMKALNERLNQIKK